MSELIERMMAVVPAEWMAGAAKKIQDGATGLEATLQSKLPRLFRAPVSTTGALVNGISSFVDSLGEITDFSVPQDKREELAAFVESKGPPFLNDLVLFAREKLAQLESDPKALSYLSYFIRAERTLPYSTVFALGYLVKLAEDSPSVVYNLIAQLKAPEFEESAESEERSRPSLEWASRVVKNVYFPFGVRAVAAIESVLTGRKLHVLDDAKAVGGVNESLKEVKDAPPLRSDFAILRNGESHPVTGFEVRADGSAVLRDKNKGPIELSPSACAEIGTDALQETARIVAALAIPAFWRLAEDLAVSNIVAVIATELRGEVAPELLSEMEALRKATEAQLIKVGLLPQLTIAA